MLLYNSLVPPYIQYAILIWGNSCQNIYVDEVAQTQDNKDDYRYNDATSPICTYFESTYIESKYMCDLYTTLCNSFTYFVTKNMPSSSLNICIYHRDVQDERHSTDPKPHKVNS